MVENGFGSHGSVWGGWRSRDISGSHGVGLWKYICMGWQIFKSYIRFDLGDGTKIQSWDDVWCGDRPLKDVFPGCSILPTSRKRLLQTIWSDLMVLYNGTSSLCG